MSRSCKHAYTESIKFDAIKWKAADDVLVRNGSINSAMLRIGETYICIYIISAMELVRSVEIKIQGILSKLERNIIRVYPVFLIFLSSLLQRETFEMFSKESDFVYETAIRHRCIVPSFPISDHYLNDNFRVKMSSGSGRD